MAGWYRGSPEGSVQQLHVAEGVHDEACSLQDALVSEGPLHPLHIHPLTVSTQVSQCILHNTHTHMDS